MFSLLQESQLDTTGILKNAPVYPYWKSGYYDSIPKTEIMLGDSLQPFSDILSRYQSKDFEYVESISNKLSFLDTLFDRIQKFLADLFPQPKGEFNEGFFNLFAVVGGLILLFLIYKFFVSQKKNYIKYETEQEEKEEQIDFVERNLLQVDVRTYLSEAIQQKNYALAIRYLQLMNIQLLGRKGIVHWNQARTNQELIAEVENKELKTDFLICSSFFDYVWFGGFEISEGSYEKYAARFMEFQRRWS